MGQCEWPINGLRAFSPALSALNAYDMLQRKIEDTISYLYGVHEHVYSMFIYGSSRALGNGALELNYIYSS
jgi:hypothetical protein